MGVDPKPFCAKMIKFFHERKVTRNMDRLWKADLKNGTFQNPILFADYSDPDVIRVGDTFYMTASSFNYVPG